MLSVRRVGTRFLRPSEDWLARGGKKISADADRQARKSMPSMSRNRRPHVGPTRKLRATKSANTTTTTSAASYIALVCYFFADGGHRCHDDCRHRQPTPLHAHTPPHAAIVAATITTKVKQKRTEPPTDIHILHSGGFRVR